MKFSKSLLAVIAMAGTMGFSAVASAMDFSVYGSIRGGLRQADADDRQVMGAQDEITVQLAGVVTQANLEAALVTSGFSVAGAAAYVATIDPTPGVAGLTDAEVADIVGDVVEVNVGAEDAVNADLTVPNNRLDGDEIGTGATVLDASAFAGEGVVVEAPDAQLDLGHRYTAAWSRIGIRGTEDLGNGAEAGFDWQTGIADNGGATNGRLANVWYSGAFGKVTAGQQANPYRNAANWDQTWFWGGNNRYDDGGTRLQGLRYDGEAGDFNFSVMATAANAAANSGAERTIVIQDGIASSTLEYAEVEAETGIDSWIATGHYDMGVATINLGYQTNNNEAQFVGESYDNFVISANGVLDALSWYVAFESNTDNSNVKRTDNLAEVPAVAGAVTQADADAVALSNRNVELVTDALGTAQDATTIGLFLGYNLSDASLLYLQWEDSANDGLDLNGDNLDRNATLLGFSRRVGPNSTFIAEYLTVDNTSEYAADNTLLVGVLKVDF